MSTNRLKTAKELKLKEDVYCALVQALDVLENQRWPEHKFDMAHWWNGRSWWWREGREDAKHECDSACCIGGTAEAIVRKHGMVRDACRVTPALYELCYPSPAGYNPYSATQAQGAKALRNYLMTGKANWEQVMNGK